jgi:predicted CXXCH cytochrome family protein
VRSLRTKRRQFVVGLALAALGAVVMALSGPWREKFVTPGPLSMHHAQLIAAGDRAQGCAKCHSAASATLAAWDGRAIDDRGALPTQAALCLACHKNKIDAAVALAAHTMPADHLHQLAGAPDGPVRAPRRDPAQPIACSACHREHQGANHNLAAVSDQTCQACHRQQFHSFADGHPDFGAWPYARPTAIAFDHAAHQAKHFPAAQRQFDCAACHRAASTGDRQLTLDYAAACATCHDKALVASLADGAALISLPTIDVDALRQAGHDVGPWPEQATGDFDGALPMPARLLIAADPRAAAALAKLGPECDFFDVDPANADQLAAAAQVVAALKALAADLASDGDAALAERLQTVARHEVTPAQREALYSQLPVDSAARFNALAHGTPSASGAAAPATPLPAGWQLNHQNLSLRYQPAGHDDPWLRAWLDLLADAASGPQAALAEPLLRSALKPTAPGQCGSCHRAEKDAAGRFAVQWRALAPNNQPTSITHFSHAPHIPQSSLRDCTACHQVASPATTSAATAASAAPPTAADFTPLLKSTCAACHAPTAAGNNCTQCHRYHAPATIPANAAQNPHVAAGLALPTH